MINKRKRERFRYLRIIAELVAVVCPERYDSRLRKPNLFQTVEDNADVPVRER